MVDHIRFVCVTVSFACGGPVFLHLRERRLQELDQAGRLIEVDLRWKQPAQGFHILRSDVDGGCTRGSDINLNAGRTVPRDPSETEWRPQTTRDSSATGKLRLRSSGQTCMRLWINFQPIHPRPPSKRGSASTISASPSNTSITARPAQSATIGLSQGARSTETRPMSTNIALDVV